MEMYRPRVIESQMKALEDIAFKKRLAKVRARMEQISTTKKGQS